MFRMKLAGCVPYLDELAIHTARERNVARAQARADHRGDRATSDGHLRGTHVSQKVECRGQRTVAAGCGDEGIHVALI
jgi:hypothetical protein